MRNNNRKSLIPKILITLVVLDLVIVILALHNKSTKDNGSLSTTTTPLKTAKSTETPKTTATPTPESAYFHAVYDKSDVTVESASAAATFQSDWILTLNEGYAYNSDTYDTSVLYVEAGALNASYEKQGIALRRNTTYTVYFNLSSDVSNAVWVSIINGDTGNVITSTTIQTSSDLTYNTFSFTMKEADTWSGILRFDLSATYDNAGNVTISGLRIIGDDNDVGIRVNQVGYSSSNYKQCTFPYSQGNLFDVVNAETKEIVYSGVIVSKKWDYDTNETTSIGDFSSFKTPGTYYIRSQTGAVSDTFVIDEDPYEEISKDVLKMLSYQRCGSALTEWAGNLAHDVCHTSLATVLYMTDTYDVTGGWHDAGDYGRYVKTGTKAVSDLLLAYMYQPSFFTDDTGGPDSNNGIPDVLDEARYELEWLLKMQNTGGGVFARVVTQTFPDDFASPESDTAPLTLMGEETVSTADFAGTMAISYLVFKDIDSTFAAKCLAAAQKADAVLQATPQMNTINNPSDYSAGQYLDDNDTDGRFYTELALWAATKDSSYLERAKNRYTYDTSVAKGLSWKTNGTYGVLIYLAEEDAQSADPDFYQSMLDVLKEQADSLLEISDGSNYGYSETQYSWGSNSLVANNGILLMNAFHYLGDPSYYKAAVSQLDYILGRNSLNECFVTGYGTNSPTSIHNRLSLSKNSLINGTLVGGPNFSREDSITQSLSESTPNAKVYADDYRSYSTNECAIYYNSALLYLLTMLR